MTGSAKRLIAEDLCANGNAKFGVWDSSVWMQCGTDPDWQLIDASVPNCLTSGDVNGDDLTDIIASFENGTFYRDSLTKSWVSIGPRAEQLVTGDIDTDNRDDLIGIWPDGVWVRYGLTGQWQHISQDKPLWIFMNKMTDTVETESWLDLDIETMPTEKIIDLSEEGPGSVHFMPLEESGPDASNR